MGDRIVTTKIILGPPGTGKTEYLLRKVEEQLEAGIKPNRIGYFAYTVKAANEARTRAMNRFKFLDKKDFMYFRTLHSLAFKQLGLTKDDVMKDNHYKELSELLGIKLSNTNRKMDSTGFQLQDDMFAKVIDMARVRNVTLKEQFHEMSHMEGGWMKLKYIADGIKEYKKTRKLYDFTDMIIEFSKSNNEEMIPNLDVLIIDEAQDLLPIQWKMVKKIMKKAGEVYIAGDDDQSIFKWAGANPEDLIGLQGDRYILDKSHRVPAAVHKISTKLINKVQNRIPKVWKPKTRPTQYGIIKDAEDLAHGTVTHHVTRGSVYKQIERDKGEWLVMTRDNYTLEQVADEMKTKGFYFSVHGQPSVSNKRLTAIMAWTDIAKNGKQISLDKVRTMYHYMTVKKGVAYGHKGLIHADPDKLYGYEDLAVYHGLLIPRHRIWHHALDRMPAHEVTYIVSLLRRKEKLSQEPRINLSTIHGAKGGEADNVALLADLPRKADEAYYKDPDNERRVFYVGMTRTKKNLHLVRSDTDREFKEMFYD
jgi:DNA helicase II / ATP-dependent DNA helicase PcrA